MADADVLRLMYCYHARNRTVTTSDLWIQLPYSFFQIDQALESLLRRGLIMKNVFVPVINTSDDGTIESYSLVFLNRQQQNN